MILLVLVDPVPAACASAVADESNYAEDTTTRQAYDLLVTGFGEGFNGPLLLVAELPDGADPADLAVGDRRGRRGPRRGVRVPPVPNDPADPTAVLWQVVPSSGPQAEATTAPRRAAALRRRCPRSADSTGVDVLVSGTVAVNNDFSDYLSSRMPYFLGAVLLLSFLLLMVVFRSLLVPLKAVIMNLLSIGAAYGDRGGPVPVGLAERHHRACSRHRSSHGPR